MEGTNISVRSVLKTKDNDERGAKGENEEGKVTKKERTKLTTQSAHNPTTH
jgi:hypothetical protein